MKSRMKERKVDEKVKESKGNGGATEEHGNRNMHANQGQMQLPVI